MVKRSRASISGVLVVGAAIHGHAYVPTPPCPARGRVVLPSMREGGKTVGRSRASTHLCLVAGSAAVGDSTGLQDETFSLPEGAGSVTEIPTTSPRVKKRTGKDPQLVIDGDSFVNTPKMVALVGSTLFFTGLIIVQAASQITDPLTALGAVLAAGLGVVLADLVSGIFHWSVDNYGDINTPVFGSVIAAFQGHHESPWTITYRPFANNVHKICYAVLPLMGLMELVRPGPAGLCLGASFLVFSLLSQEIHRYAHMNCPPPVAAWLQDRGIILSRREHGAHHCSPFKGQYCIVNGMCNKVLDSSQIFRKLEKLIYELTGNEPNTWVLDPALKAASLES